MTVTKIRITARPAEGWRRSGIRHPAQPTDHPVDRFSDEELAALRADPNLIVELVGGGETAPNLIAPVESNHGESGLNIGTEPAAKVVAETEGVADATGKALGGGRRNTASRPEASNAPIQRPVETEG